MKIGYVAKHDSGGNDDEGAISHALRQLGHEVHPLREARGHNARSIEHGVDFWLFHHWHGPGVLASLAQPKVFWYFDLVEWPGDPSVAKRCEARVGWMRETLPLVDLGFCTDGDWVAKDRTGKLRWLPQGADERVVGAGNPPSESPGKYPSILFTGIAKGGGQLRESFVAEMLADWDGQFNHVAKGVYRENLRALIAASEIVVAPDSPITDNYCSNRVWNALGFGAFMLHPWCKRLATMLLTGRDGPNAVDSPIVFYRSREDLHSKIRYYLLRPKERAAIAKAGLEAVRARHLYRHRCEELVRVVQERLF